MGNRMSSSLIDRTTEKEITQRVVSFFVCNIIKRLESRDRARHGKIAPVERF